MKRPAHLGDGDESAVGSDQRCFAFETFGPDDFPGGEGLTGRDGVDLLDRESEPREVA